MTSSCAAPYGQCNELPCCDALYACHQRNGRVYRQCRPYVGNCVDGTWLCPRKPPPAPPTPPQPAQSNAAARFAESLGPGINLMSSNIRWSQLSRTDYIGLSARVGHVRLCGDGLVSLINWTNCPARNWQADPALSEADAQAAARERIVSDPAWRLFKAAAKAVLRHGMRLVLNPLHKKWAITLDEALVRRFWSVVIDEFDIDAFPLDDVAFEMVNEPGNWNTWSVHNRFGDLHMGFVELVQGAQPGRVLILPAEMGNPRCGPDGPSDHFLQSWEAILSKRPGNGAESLRRFAHSAYPIIG